MYFRHTGERENQRNNVLTSAGKGRAWRGQARNRRIGTDWRCLARPGLARHDGARPGKTGLGIAGKARLD